MIGCALMLVDKDGYRLEPRRWLRAKSTFPWAVTLGCLSCAVTPPAPPLSASGAAGNANKESANPSVINGEELSGRHSLPAPPDPSLWAGIERPDPRTVTLAMPGGNVDDAHAAALVRLLEEPLDLLRDKGDQVRVLLSDASHWKRVRFRGFEHLAGFRYGEKYHAVSSIIVSDTRGGRAADSMACIRQIETKARPVARTFSVEFGAIEETEIHWKGKRVVVHSVEGAFPWGFRRVDFSAAWAAYPAYEKACLIYGISVKHENNPVLARLVRDRWILESVPKLETLTVTKPVRKP